MKVIPSAHFERNYKKYFSKLDDRQRKKVENNIDLFVGNPFLPQFRTHKLTTGEWAFTVLRDGERNDRIIFEKNGEKIILLVVGSHDEVY